LCKYFIHFSLAMEIHVLPQSFLQCCCCVFDHNVL
jgi:hypothetical protein